jgi:hypothetical protein
MRSPRHLANRAKLAAQIMLFATTAITSAPCNAQIGKSRVEEFRAFYDEFLAGVRANDKNRIADLIEFPVRDWSVERKGNVETIGIANRADFLAGYDLFFTPLMRSHALKAKPQKISDDHHALIWQDADAEFSFEFEYKPPHGFRLTAYGIGPR